MKSVTRPTKKTWRFQAADGSTLFLDEVGETPPEMQSKLLRVLQEGKDERVGEGITRKVKVRIIAAPTVSLPRKWKPDDFARICITD